MASPALCHKEWRKCAKKERRRRRRIQEAKERDGDLACNTIEYQNWLKEQEELEIFELEQIEKRNMEENEKWLIAENNAVKQWQKLQEKRERLRMQHLEEELKRRQEWELEQERKIKEEERLKEIEEETKRKQEIFMKHLEKFLSGDSEEPPEELLVSRETKPECDPCPFFAKTACCRFGDQCSRNHRYPGISKVLLAANFFSHFGLENANEYDADIMLEYEDCDTYIQYKDFFNDVLPEFEKFGRITQFKVCNNYEKHLRGNTYVEFAELRCAVAAYRALHTRWYGGKQLSLQFCLISSWKNAICGLQSRKRCPKGRSCNFLHVFRNPNNMFNSVREYQEHSERPRRTPPRTWRWSESPEVEVSRRRRSRSSERRSSKRERSSRHEIRRDRRERRESPPRKRRDRHSPRRKERDTQRRKTHRTASNEKSDKRHTEKHDNLLEHQNSPAERSSSESPPQKKVERKENIDKRPTEKRDYQEHESSPTGQSPNSPPQKKREKTKSINQDNYSSKRRSSERRHRGAS